MCAYVCVCVTAEICRLEKEKAADLEKFEHHKDQLNSRLLQLERDSQMALAQEKQAHEEDCERLTQERVSVALRTLYLTTFHTHLQLGWPWSQTYMPTRRTARDSHRRGSVWHLEHGNSPHFTHTAGLALVPDIHAPQGGLRETHTGEGMRGISSSLEHLLRKL